LVRERVRSFVNFPHPSWPASDSFPYETVPSSTDPCRALCRISRVLFFYRRSWESKGWYPRDLVFHLHLFELTHAILATSETRWSQHKGCPWKCSCGRWMPYKQENQKPRSLLSLKGKWVIFLDITQMSWFRDFSKCYFSKIFGYYVSLCIEKPCS
jgi:hypothetical protein